MSTKHSWFKGLTKPKAHVTAEDFSLPLPIGDRPTGPPDKVHYSGVRARRGYAIPGAECLASIVTNGDKAVRHPYAPMPQRVLTCRLTPEQRTDLYLSGELKSWQIPGALWPAVRLYRQLALQAEMLNEVPAIVDQQMNEIYDAVLEKLQEESQ